MRIVDLLNAVAETLRTSEKFDNVRVQLDPYDLEDVVKESFQPPTARVLFSLAKPIHRAPGSVDLECAVTVAIITARTGRADPNFASADIAALDLALQTSQLINDDPYFGLTGLTAAVLDGFKVAVSEKANDKGLAITIVMFKTTLLEVIAERFTVGEAVGTRLPGPDVEFPPSFDDILGSTDHGF